MLKHKILSVDEKIKLLRELEDGFKNPKICKKYDLPSSTVSSLLKNKEKLMAVYDQNKNDYKHFKKCAK